MILTLYDWSDPDGIKAHALDVVELGLEALEGATTVVTQISTRAAAIVATAAGDAVCEGEVDVARFPRVGVGSNDASRELQKQRHDAR